MDLKTRVETAPGQKVQSRVESHLVQMVAEEANGTDRTSRKDLTKMADGINEVKSEQAPVVEPPAERPSRMIRWSGAVYRRVRGLLAMFMLVLILFLVLPIPERLYAWLDVTSPPRSADAIICIGGDPARLLWAMDAYRRRLAPKLIVTNLPGASEWMRDKLVQCGIPSDRILMDSTSGTTWDHPSRIARLPGVDPANQRFLIVTSHDHSRRVAACFRRGGYQRFSIYGAGFPLRTDGAFQMRVRWRILELPHIIYEYAALFEYWWQGRI